MLFPKIVAGLPTDPRHSSSGPRALSQLPPKVLRWNHGSRTQSNPYHCHSIYKMGSSVVLLLSFVLPLSLWAYLLSVLALDLSFWGQLQGLLFHLVSCLHHLFGPEPLVTSSSAQHILYWLILEDTCEKVIRLWYIMSMIWLWVILRCHCDYMINSRCMHIDRYYWWVLMSVHDTSQVEDVDGINIVPWNPDWVREWIVFGLSVIFTCICYMIDFSMDVMYMDYWQHSCEWM